MSARGILCPDCGVVIFGAKDACGDRAAFVAHREQEHPPAPKTITGTGGIASQETVGTPGGGS